MDTPNDGTMDEEMRQFALSLRMFKKSKKESKLHCSFCERVYDKKTSLRSHILHFHPLNLITCSGCKVKKRTPNDGTFDEDTFNEKITEYIKHRILKTGKRLARHTRDRIPKNKPGEEFKFSACRWCRELYCRTQEFINRAHENLQDLQHDNSQVSQNPSDHVSPGESHQVLHSLRNREDENQRVSPNTGNCRKENPKSSRDHQNQGGNPWILENQGCSPGTSTRFFQDQRLHPSKIKPLSEDFSSKLRDLPNKKKPHGNSPLHHKNLRIRIDALYRPAVSPGISLNPILRPIFNPRICFNPLYCFHLNQSNDGQNLSPNINEKRMIEQNGNPPEVQEVSLKPNDHSKGPLNCSKDLPDYQNAPLSPVEDPSKKLSFRINPLYRPAVSPGINLNPMLRQTFSPRICLNPLYRLPPNQLNSRNQLPNPNRNNS